MLGEFSANRYGSAPFGYNHFGPFGANAALRPFKLAVDTHDGVVTLRGQVNNVEQRNAAQLEARAVKGVKAVKNELTVR